MRFLRAHPSLRRTQAASAPRAALSDIQDDEEEEGEED